MKIQLETLILMQKKESCITNFQVPKSVVKVAKTCATIVLRGHRNNSTETFSRDGSFIAI